MKEITGSNASSHEIGSGNSCTRTFLTPWSNRFEVAEALLGTAHPSLPWAWVKGVKIDPFPDEAKAAGGDIDPATAEISYLWSKLTAEYATDFGLAQHWPEEIPKPDVREHTTLTLECENTAEFLRVPARAMRWADNMPGYPGAPVPESDSAAGRLLVAKTEFQLKWDYLADVPVGRLRGLVGAVNDDEFLGCAAETLLFMGFDLRASTRASIEEPGCWAVQAKFSHRDILIDGTHYGWNHEYRPDGWKRVKMQYGSGWKDRYEPKDFSDMFT